MSARVSHTSRNPSCDRSRASALARYTPLMPPAEEAAIVSITTRVRTPPSDSALARRSSRYTLSLDPASPSALGAASRSPLDSAPPGSPASSAEPRTSRWSSLVTPCM
jgi:hypothetical protein